MIYVPVKCKTKSKENQTKPIETKRNEIKIEIMSPCPRFSVIMKMKFGAFHIICVVNYMHFDSFCSIFWSPTGIIQFDLIRLSDFQKCTILLSICSVFNILYVLHRLVLLYFLVRNVTNSINDVPYINKIEIQHYIINIRKRERKHCFH